MSVRREFRFVMYIEKTGTSSKTSVVKYPQHHKKNRSEQVFLFCPLLVYKGFTNKKSN